MKTPALPAPAERHWAVAHRQNAAATRGAEPGAHEAWIEVSPREIAQRRRHAATFGPAATSLGPVVQRVVHVGGVACKTVAALTTALDVDPAAKSYVEERAAEYRRTLEELLERLIAEDAKSAEGIVLDDAWGLVGRLLDIARDLDSAEEPPKTAEDIQRDLKDANRQAFNVWQALDPVVARETIERVTQRAINARREPLNLPSLWLEFEQEFKQHPIEQEFYQLWKEVNFDVRDRQAPATKAELVERAWAEIKGKTLLQKGLNPEHAKPGVQRGDPDAKAKMPSPPTLGNAKQGIPSSGIYVPRMAPYWSTGMLYSGSASTVYDLRGADLQVSEYPHSKWIELMKNPRQQAEAAKLIAQIAESQEKALQVDPTRKPFNEVLAKLEPVNLIGFYVACPSDRWDAEAQNIKNIVDEFRAIDPNLPVFLQLQDTADFKLLN